MMHHPRRIALLVAFMSMIGPFSIDTYLPSFPGIAAEFGATHLQMQQTMSLYLLAFAVTTLIYGPLADAFGRRVVVLWSLALYAFASLGCALSGSIGELLLFRIAQGLTASAGFVVGRAVVRDLFEGARAQRAISHVMLLFALAPALAPIIGGYLHDVFGWRAVFAFLAAIGAALWWVIYLSLPETLPRDARHSIHPAAVGRVYGRALTTGGFMLIVAMIALNFGGLFLYVSGAPELIYTHLQMGARSFAVLFVPVVAGIMLGSLVSGRMAGKVDMLRAAAVGYAIMAAAILFNMAQALWLPISPAWVVAPVAIYAFGNALAVPSLSLIALDYFPHNRGMASSAQGFVHTGSNALVAGALVPLVSFAVSGMVIGMAALYAASLTLWLLWLRLAAPEKAGAKSAA